MLSSSDYTEVNCKDNVFHRKKTEIVKGVSNSKSNGHIGKFKWLHLHPYSVRLDMCGESTLESVPAAASQLITRKK